MSLRERYRDRRTRKLAFAAAIGSTFGLVFGLLLGRRHYRR